MKWLIREVSLVATIGAFVAGLEPGWISFVLRVGLVIVCLLVCAAFLMEVLGRVPIGPPPPAAHRPNFEAAQRMRDIEQAKDFAVGVDYSLFPFLEHVIREIANQRLVEHHGIVLGRDEPRARHLLGEMTWRLVAQGDGPHGRRGAPNLSRTELAAVVDVLESI